MQSITCRTAQLKPMDSFGSWRKWKWFFFFFFFFFSRFFFLSVNAEFYWGVWTINALLMVRSEMLPFSGNNHTQKCSESPRTLCHRLCTFMIICHCAILHYNMSFKTIAWMSGGVFWWFPALFEDQNKICWIHQNYLVALICQNSFYNTIQCMSTVCECSLMIKQLHLSELLQVSGLHWIFQGAPLKSRKKEADFISMYIIHGGYWRIYL